MILNRRYVLITVGLSMYYFNLSKGGKGFPPGSGSIVIRLTAQDAKGAVELLEQDDAGQLVGKGEAG
ncbi:hypothetical protein Tph_c28030 [Thermacetogenium phaeum DSM 12270]|uniref:Uncharacterized protein n=1 Tax=Thermacetogenium phaeum (strain ATCC BAA-254 / DSM 26808 / PB) TaxID=1089553 RepID=K4LJA9_THEPS|nr:hypothetical protein Tph_c28030 [Thermacetogenium phaeum DSM 12270]MDN5375490.1 hypothetical protein [Thermacetogenium sp.]